MNRRQLTTVLHLLRYHAEYTRRMHGETLPERPGGVELTPSEMETWADELEKTYGWGAQARAACDAYEKTLPGRSEMEDTSWLG